jgi:hypothetical protein
MLIDLGKYINWINKLEENFSGPGAIDSAISWTVDSMNSIV